MENCNLLSSMRHSYLRKDFQILLAANEGAMKSQHPAVGHTANQMTNCNGPVNAHLISEPIVSTKPGYK